MPTAIIHVVTNAATGLQYSQLTGPANAYKIHTTCKLCFTLTLTSGSHHDTHSFCLAPSWSRWDSWRRSPAAEPVLEDRIHQVGQLPHVRETPTRAIGEASQRRLGQEPWAGRSEAAGGDLNRRRPDRQPDTGDPDFFPAARRWRHICRDGQSRCWWWWYPATRTAATSSSRLDTARPNAKRPLGMRIE